MNFLSELKRRRVFRTGGAYLVGVWVILQVIDVVGPAIGLPDWTMTAGVIAAAVGLPVVLALSWAYDLTPEGLQKAEELDDERQGSALRGRWIELAVFTVLLVAVAYLLTDKLVLRDSPDRLASAQEISIAVLPFDDLSSDDSQGYLADGITEEILNVLAGIRQFRVTSRTSTFALRGYTASIPEIGEMLDVRYVLEGSVRVAGSRVRITAQLIDADNDAHLWSDTYDRDLTVADLFDVEDTVARNVSDQLRTRILPGDEVSRRPPASYAALDAYLDGRAYLRQIETGQSLDDATFQAAIERFEASIEEDPEWAPSQHALGAIYHFWMTLGDFENRWRRSSSHIDKALSLDPEYQDALVSRGYLLLQVRDLAGALDAYDQIEYPRKNGHWGMAVLDSALARYESSLEHYAIAKSLDPLSESIRIQYVATLSCAGRYGESIREIQTFLEGLPEEVRTEHWLVPDLAYAHAKQGRIDTALELANAWSEGLDYPILMTPVYALAGNNEKVDAILDFYDSVERFPVPPYLAGAVIAGQSERALTKLEAYAAQDPMALEHFRCYEDVRSLASDARYKAALEKMGVPEAYR